MKPRDNPPMSFPLRTLLAACALLVGLGATGNALAYKVERVCETTASTSKKPAIKVCKTLLVKPAPAAVKDDKKDANPGNDAEPAPRCAAPTSATAPATAPARAIGLP